MKGNFWPLRAAIALALVGLTRAGGASGASESVRVYLPATPELDVLHQRLRSLEDYRGRYRQDFIFSFPPTRKLAVKIAVYRDGKLDGKASGLFHIYGIPSNPVNANATNAGFFSLMRDWPQPPDKPRNGFTENSWEVAMPSYYYGFSERANATTTDYQDSAGFAETAELRRGKVVMKANTGKFRLSVWVQTVPRQKTDPRYGIKRFLIAPTKPASR